MTTVKIILDDDSPRFDYDLAVCGSAMGYPVTALVKIGEVVPDGWCLKGPVTPRGMVDSSFTGSLFDVPAPILREI